MIKEDTAMSKNTDLAPVAFVRPGVQRPPGRGPLRGRPTPGAQGLRREERLPGGPRVRGRGRERRGSQTGLSSARCWTRPASPTLPSRKSWSGSFRGSPASGSTPSPSSPCSGAKGIRVVSITEHADDTPTGKLMEAIIESVDEFYSENLAQEVTRGNARGRLPGASG